MDQYDIITGNLTKVQTEYTYRGKSVKRIK